MNFILMDNDKIMGLTKALKTNLYFTPKMIYNKLNDGNKTIILYFGTLY